MTKVVFFFITFLLTLTSAFSDSNCQLIIRLTSTTSTENSDLLRYLLPQFEEDTDHTVDTMVNVRSAEMKDKNLIGDFRIADKVFFKPVVTSLARLVNKDI